MKSVLIVCAAPQPAAAQFYRRLVRAHEGPLVAADGGGSVCLDAGRAPDLLVGDFDSLPAGLATRLEKSGATVLRAPVMKDVTDLDLAIDAALGLGAERAIVTASWTDRLDHTLAAAGALLRRDDLVLELVDPGVRGWVTDASSNEEIVLSGTGATFSLLAVDPETRITCVGARYPLHGEPIGVLSSRGISNVIKERAASIRADRGRLLVLTHATGEVPMANGARVTR